MKCRFAYALATGVSFLLLSGTLSAQEISADTNHTQKRSANRMLEEVVVTAQKREESLQEVPIAIAAYSQQKLDAMGIESVQDLEKISPGLTITNAAGFNIAYLRGIGTDAFLPGADSSVPFYIDGVALLGSQGASDTLGRVERTEVLKGPQGTLFGRNATGGAISIITPEPSTEEFFGDIKLERADYDEENAILFLNAPFTDNIAATLSLYKQSHNNYYTNTSPTGPKFPDISAEGGRAKLKWDVTDRMSLTLSYSQNEGVNNAGLSFENTRVPIALRLLIPTDPEADRKVNFDEAAGAAIESFIQSATFEYDFDWVTTKLIASRQELDAYFVQSDFDASPSPVASLQSYGQLSKQDTLELQFISTPDAPFGEHIEWVAGIYYLESSGGLDPLAINIANSLTNSLPDVVTDVLGALSELLGGVIPTEVTLLSSGILESESLSFYFQNTWYMTPTLDLTIGMRYQEEARNLVNGRADLQGATPGKPGINIRMDSVPELTSYLFSPKIALQWRPFGEDTQFYGSVSRAYKSPTYNTVNFLDTPESVEEETVTSYEIGTKTELFDSGLRLNAALFLIEQEDLLTGYVALASGGVVTYDNAGESEVLGAEMDFLWAPFPNWNPGLVLTGATTYLDTEYTDYPDGRGFDEETGLSFGEGALTGLPARDFTSNDIVRSPKWTSTLGFNQAIDLSIDHTIEVGADVYYNSGFFFLPQNSDLYSREEYALVTARISYFYHPWELQITAFGENITDETYNENVFVADFGRNQVLNAPRVFGVRLNWGF